MAKISEAAKAEAIARLKKILKPGDAVKCVLRHVSSSGMSRRIDFYHINRKGEMIYLSGYISTACGITRSRTKDGLVVSGCGMDMGFHVVYELARTLWPKGCPCIGKKCRSNDHSNGDRDYTPHTKSKPHMHDDGGYALRHEWI